MALDRFAAAVGLVGVAVLSAMVLLGHIDLVEAGIRAAWTVAGVWTSTLLLRGLTEVLIATLPQPEPAGDSFFEDPLAL